jgi:hypothetical protein
LFYRLGCATSPAIAHCEAALAERPPPLPSTVNGLFLNGVRNKMTNFDKLFVFFFLGTETRCARLGPLSPFVCLDVNNNYIFQL